MVVGTLRKPKKLARKNGSREAVPRVKGADLAPPSPTLLLTKHALKKGLMAALLPRITLPRTPLNKDKKGGRRLVLRPPFFLSLRLGAPLDRALLHLGYLVRHEAVGLAVYGLRGFLVRGFG